MATNGFEFVGWIDGRLSGPRIMDFDMTADTAGYLKGDMLIIDSAGRMDKAAANAGELSAVCMESTTSAVAADDHLKVAILAKGQIWRCSADAAACAAIEGYTKTVNLIDENTIDATPTTGGSLICWKVDVLEDTTYATVYVCPADTSFEND